ncbi:MAG: glycosyltransferase family 2 protein, partial [Thermoanaerobaculia bacterium]
DRGLVGIESLPRHGAYRWRSILERKEELAAELDADWFLHVDADELRLPPSSEQSLAEAFAGVDDAGFNAVNFFEFTFVPTRQSPDHDHPEFLDTMRWYYPFQPTFPHQLKAWKRQTERVDLTSSAGHLVGFPGLRMYPQSFPMRHYLFLSQAHAMSKYVQRAYDAEELARGWHRLRSRLRPEHIVLQEESELRRYVSDDLLDPSDPLVRHPLFGS